MSRVPLCPEGADFFLKFGVGRCFESEKTAGGFNGEVVGCSSETAADDDSVGAVECGSYGAAYSCAGVAAGAGEADLKTVGGQEFSELGYIGVDCAAGQEFIAGKNTFKFHSFSVVLSVDGMNTAELGAFFILCPASSRSTPKRRINALSRSL